MSTSSGSGFDRIRDMGMGMAMNRTPYRSRIICRNGRPPLGGHQSAGTRYNRAVPQCSPERAQTSRWARIVAIFAALGFTSMSASTYSAGARPLPTRRAAARPF